MIKKKDLEDLRNQINAWNIQPTTMLMSDWTWKSIMMGGLRDLYAYVLKYNYSIDGYIYEDGESSLEVELRMPGGADTFTVKIFSK